MPTSHRQQSAQQYPCPVAGCLVFSYDTPEELADHMAQGDHLLSLTASKVAEAALGMAQPATRTHGTGDGTDHGGSSHRAAPYDADATPCTPKQAAFLARLGWVPSDPNWTQDQPVPLSKAEATVLIDQLLKARDAGVGTCQAPLCSQKQAEYLRSLLATRQHHLDNDRLLADLEAGKVDGKCASALIDQLRTAPKAQPQAGAAGPLADGVYLVDGEYRLVYHTVHGANMQVAKALRIHEHGDHYEGEWEYLGQRGLRGVTAAHKLTEEQARKFGQVYGFCVRCGRTLTMQESKYVGYGATCARHMGWWYPTAAELRELQRQEVAQ